MSIKTVPARKVEVCDKCRRETACLQVCLICGKDFCYSCKTTICGSWVSPDLCRECGYRDDVQKLCDQAASKITPILKARDGKISKLKPEPIS